MVFSAYLRCGHGIEVIDSGHRVVILREGFLSRFLSSGLRGLLVAAALGLLAPVCLADNNNPMTLDTSETLFAVLTAMNSCGYNVNLNISDAQRLNIRAEVERNLQKFGRRAGGHDRDVRLVPGAPGEGSGARSCRSMFRWRCICRGLRIFCRA